MIFYFSGTGNTLWAARRLAEATGERLVAMADGLPTPPLTLAEGERVGFCFPVHGWQPPKLVRWFIDSLCLEGMQGHYVYALCTCGDSVGQAMEMLRGQLARKGWPLHAVFSLVMPESYVTLPFMYTDPPRRERYKLLRAGHKLRDMEQYVKERRTGIDKVERGPAAWLLSHVIGNVFNGCLITDKPFRVEASLCNRCGRCASACPLGNITAAKGDTPTWRRDGRCAACLACYHHCPRHAIGYGPLTKRRGQYYFGRNQRQTDTTPYTQH